MTRWASFGSLTNETVVGIAGTNTIIRHWDAYGRTTGYSLVGRVVPNVPQRQTTIGYDAATGRIATMLANGSEVPFTWSYLPGSDLKSSLAYPNGLTASWTYDANDQLLQVRNATPTNVISQYDYTYDAAGRRVACGKSGSTFAENDTLSYGYNEKSELTNVVAAVDAGYRYAYVFDDIGNRDASSECGVNSVYVANLLNQYTSISNSALSANPDEIFNPSFDLDGNQTLVRTSTGDWHVTYNSENRPIQWLCGNTNITMKFDRMGRRVECIETVDAGDDLVVTNMHHRFVCDDYLCIQRLNPATNSAVNLVFGWDPTEFVLTRPLWMQHSAESYNFFYFHDGNKNVSELVSCQSAHGVPAHYEYGPFGAVTAAMTNTAFTVFNVAETNPFRYSSEYADDKLDLLYYNFRHYNPNYGVWVSRDKVQMSEEYRFVENAPLNNIDVLGDTTDKRRSCKIYKNQINCLGYAIGANYCVDPHTMSIDSLMETLGYKGSDVADKDCQCESCDKKLVYVYVYIYPPEFAVLNAKRNIDLNTLSHEEVIRRYRFFRKNFLKYHPSPLSEEDFWCPRVFAVDYHAMSKDCSVGNGKWRYVPARLDKGDVRATPKELDRDSYFNNDFQVIAGKCYKKAKGK